MTMSKVLTRPDDHGGKPKAGWNKLTEYIDDAPGLSTTSAALKRLGRLAIAKGFTPALLATKAEIAPSNLRDIFRRRNPNVASVEAIARGLRLSDFALRALLNEMSNADLALAESLLLGYVRDGDDLFGGRGRGREVARKAEAALSCMKAARKKEACRAFVIAALDEQEADLLDELDDGKLPKPLAAVDAAFIPCGCHPFRFASEVRHTAFNESEPMLSILIDAIQESGVSKSALLKLVNTLRPDDNVPPLNSESRRIRAALKHFRAQRESFKRPLLKGSM